MQCMQTYYYCKHRHTEEGLGIYTHTKKNHTLMLRSCQTGLETPHDKTFLTVEEAAILLFLHDATKVK